MIESLKSKNASIPLFIFLITVATRIPFSSKLLYHMDSVHFALALERYDLTVHQPHPPGYFLYVMLGRLIHLLVEDANGALVTMSIVFSGLTVAAIYLLAEEIYDRKTGVVAACLAITSPNLWFHGEIALSYGAEAFFSAVAGLLCWKLYTGRGRYLWLAAAALGIAGGFRQDTVVFLLPLLLFSARKTRPGKIVAALLLLGAVCMAWFAPMVWMTGGWDAYAGAFRELWEFSTGHSVFDQGWPALSLYAKTLCTFTVYSIGAAVFPLGLAAYAHVRHGSPRTAGVANPLFFVAFTLPSFFFYLLIFIHPANPGYALILTPPLLVVSARATMHIGAELKKLFGKNITAVLTSMLLLINTGVFLLSAYPVSWRTIRSHDQDIATMVTQLRAFDPTTTVLLADSLDIFRGFRQIMYYLPQYRVYQAEVPGSAPDKSRNIFWGTGRDTFLSKEVQFPENIHCMAAVLGTCDLKAAGIGTGITVRPILPEIAIASGPTGTMLRIYPVRTIGDQSTRF